MDIAEFYEVVRSLWVLWLIILFAGIAFWAFRPKNKQRFEDDAQIPFREENGG